MSSPRFLALVLVLLPGSACVRLGFEAAHDAAPDAGLPRDSKSVDLARVERSAPPLDVLARDRGPAKEAGYPPPVIKNLTLKAQCIPEHRTTDVSVDATDPAGGKLAVAWKSGAGGTFTGTGLTATYKPPKSPYTCTHVITATVTSSTSNLSASRSASLSVTLLGDLNQDGAVNMTDFALYSNETGKTGCCASGSSCYKADLNLDCTVDNSDYALLNGNWLKTGCACP